MQPQKRKRIRSRNLIHDCDSLLWLTFEDLVAGNLPTRLNVVTVHASVSQGCVNSVLAPTASLPMVAQMDHLPVLCARICHVVQLRDAHCWILGDSNLANPQHRRPCHIDEARIVPALHEANAGRIALYAVACPRPERMAESITRLGPARDYRSFVAHDFLVVSRAKQVRVKYNVQADRLLLEERQFCPREHSLEPFGLDALVNSSTLCPCSR